MVATVDMVVAYTYAETITTGLYCILNSSDMSLPNMEATADATSVMVQMVRICIHRCAMRYSGVQCRDWQVRM